MKDIFAFFSRNKTISYLKISRAIILLLALVEADGKLSQFLTFIMKKDFQGQILLYKLALENNSAIDAILCVCHGANCQVFKDDNVMSLIFSLVQNKIPYSKSNSSPCQRRCS